MKQRLLIALLTAVGFAAGFFARSRCEKGPAVPPPPAPGTEFVRSTVPAPSPAVATAQQSTFSEEKRAKMVEHIQRIRPQIDRYRQHIDELAADFENDMRKILTDEQRDRFDAALKRGAERRARGEREVSETTTLTDRQIFDLQQAPLWNALWNVAITWRLDRLTKDLGLSEEQKAKTRELLQKRREKFLALVDSTPPPSITFSQLAPQAEKLRTKSGEAAAPAKPTP